MPRQPNDTTAIGPWNVTRPNEQRNARYGERWPMMPPDYATGYITRNNFVTSGDATPQYTAMCSWGPHMPSANTYNAISIRCTSHDWVMTYMGFCTSSYQAGLIYQNVKVWSGTEVNNPSNEITAYSNANGLWISNHGNPSQQIMHWLASSHDDNARLTQNTWYTFGQAYTQSATQNYPGWPTGYYTGQGYGNSITSLTMTSTATNAAGTTTITSDWEFQDSTGLHTSNAPWSSNAWTTSQYGGVAFVSNYVTVHE